MIYPLQQAVIYGPVKSRRYGNSLGINLNPVNRKVCSFNCVYCHYGRTDDVSTDTDVIDAQFPGLQDVLVGLEAMLRSPEQIEAVTFSGNGEPSLHPQFPELVEAVVGLRNRFRPEAKTILLSNSTGLYREEVRCCLPMLDMAVLKLDAGTAETFYKINRPSGEVRFETIVEHMLSLDDFYIQSMFIEGEPSNTTPSELDAYVALIEQLAPKGVHLYSLDRPSSEGSIKRVSPEKLEEIAARIRTESGAPATAYYAESPE
jgi:wyosine [tRNA(Phe)-imidazoG37] synthetase (radical SAM superfamily)